MPQIEPRAITRTQPNPRLQQSNRNETDFESRLKARYEAYARDDSFPSFLETLYFDCDYTSQPRRAR